MKRSIIYIVIILIGLMTRMNAQEVIELAQPQSNKVIIKLMFKVGSAIDDKGLEGITYTTAQCIEDGGTKDLTSTQIKDKIYPWAASYFVSVDKEVTIFTFEVPTVFLN